MRNPPFSQKPGFLTTDYWRTRFLETLSTGRRLGLGLSKQGTRWLRWLVGDSSPTSRLASAEILWTWGSWWVYSGSSSHSHSLWSFLQVWGRGRRQFTFFSFSFFLVFIYLFQVSTLYSRYLAAQRCHFQVVISQNRPSSDPNSNSSNLKEHPNFYPIFKWTQERNNLWPYRKFVFLNTVFVHFSNISDHSILLPNS